MSLLHWIQNWSVEHQIHLGQLRLTLVDAVIVAVPPSEVLLVCVVLEMAPESAHLDVLLVEPPSEVMQDEVVFAILVLDVHLWEQKFELIF